MAARMRGLTSEEDSSGKLPRVVRSESVPRMIPSWRSTSSSSSACMSSSARAPLPLELRVVVVVERIEPSTAAVRVWNNRSPLSSLRRTSEPESLSSI